MKKLTDKLVPALALIFAAAITVCVLTAATPSNIPISGMNITTQAVEGAYFPLIQPWPGRPTNDNWRIAKSNLFYGIGTATVTNLYVSNFFATNFYAIQTNLYFTNFYSSNIFVTNLYVENIISEDLLWTNDSASLRPADYVTYTQLAASNTIAAGWDVNTPCYQEIIAGTTILDSTSCRSFFLLSTEPDPSLAIIRLKNGRADGARLTIYCYTNLPNTGGFTLQANSAVAVSGGQVKLENDIDWVSTNGSMIELEYMITDWVEKGRGTFGITNQPQEVVINPTVGYLPVKTGPSAFSDSPWYTNGTLAAIDSGIALGPTTNFVIHRSTNALTYTSPHTTTPETPLAKFLNGTTNRYVFLSDQATLGADGMRIYGDNGSSYVTFGAKADGQDIHVKAGASGSVYLQPANGGSASYVFGTVAFLSDTANKNIGSSSSLWGDYLADGEIYLYGFGSGSSDYSRLVLDHTGTSGGPTFDSQAAGTGGSAKDFIFASNSVEVARIGASGLLSLNKLPPAILNNYFANPVTSYYYITNIYGTALTAGNNVIFTSPSGMRSIGIVTRLLSTNAAIAAYPTFGVTGTNYRSSSTLSLSAPGSGTVADGLVREPSETFGINVTSNASYFASILVFTNTTPLYTPKILNMASGDNVLYTVPTNMVAMGVAPSHNNALGPNPRYVNVSGSPRVVLNYYLPLGTTTSTFPFTDTNTVASATISTPSSVQAMIFYEGDSIVINTDASTATQSAFVTVLELPE